jgi:four helix bundle suffix protein
MTQSDSNTFIPPHGGYEKLISYQKSEIIYDGTIYFIDRFISTRDRTYDQMKQAARSGKQNIIEGSAASATSKETEIKLTNVALASLIELKGDYKDFIRNNGLTIWTKDHPYMKRFREINRTPNATYETYRKGIENKNPEICANIMLCLIHIVTYLLDRQIKRLEIDFLKEGGLRERMTKARIEQKNKQEKKQRNVNEF